MCKRLPLPLRYAAAVVISTTGALAREPAASHTCPVDINARQDLTKATADLLYPSESDFPFDLVESVAPGESPREYVTRVAGPARPVEELAPDTFFEPLLESDDDGHFARLRATLEAHLAPLQIFRVGRTEVDIYLIGQTKEGHLAGLHTRSVET